MSAKDVREESVDAIKIDGRSVGLLAEAVLSNVIVAPSSQDPLPAALMQVRPGLMKRRKELAAADFLIFFHFVNI